MTILWTTSPAVITVGGQQFQDGIPEFVTKTESPVETGLMRSQVDFTIRQGLGKNWDLRRNRGALVLGAEVVAGDFWRGRIYRFLAATQEPDTISLRAVDALWYHDNPRPAGSYIYLQPKNVLTESTVFVVQTENQPLNVRSAPSLEATVLSRLVAGALVTVVEITNGWSRLQGGGWVQAIWLAPPQGIAPIFESFYGMGDGYFAAGITVGEAVGNILGWAGYGGTVTGLDDLDVPLYNPINKEEGEGLVSHAGRLAWEYGYYLWQDPAGQLYLKRFGLGEGSVQIYSCTTASVEPDFDYQTTDTRVEVDATGYRLARPEGTGGGGEQEFAESETTETVDNPDTGEILGTITERVDWQVSRGDATRRVTTNQDWILKGVYSENDILPGTLPVERVASFAEALDTYEDGVLIETRQTVTGDGVFLGNKTNARDWVTFFNGDRNNPSYRMLLTDNVLISETVTIYKHLSLEAYNYGLVPRNRRGILAESITEERVSLLDAGQVVLKPPEDTGILVGVPPLVLRSRTTSYFGRNRQGDYERVDVTVNWDYSGTEITSGRRITYKRQGRRTTKRNPPQPEPFRMTTLPRSESGTGAPLQLTPYGIIATADTTVDSPNPAGQTRYLRAQYLADGGWAQYYAKLMAAIISGQVERVRVEIPLNADLKPWHPYQLTGGRYPGDYWCVAISHSWGPDKGTTILTLVETGTLPTPPAPGGAIIVLEGLG